ncbi:MAG TPA: hypothetical protein VFO77_06095 [Actinoplanes sp.]|nr:hypothetical protein [Actinoplanes sp.]
MVTGSIVRVALAVCVAAGLAACGDDAPQPAPTGPPISVTTMRGALLQAAEIGSSWSAPSASTPPNPLVSLCGGQTPAPAVPPGATVLTAPLVDEGTKGAQTLHQVALVYADAAAATAGLAALRAVADGCPATVSVPQRVTEGRQEPAFTETAATSPLSEGEWTGFVVIRHKVYDPKHPATSDTAVAVLAKRNVLLVEAYAIHRLGVVTSTGPQFTADWQKLVGTVVNRVD